MDGVEFDGHLGVGERLVGPDEALAQDGHHITVRFPAQNVHRFFGVQNHDIDLSSLKRG